MKIELRYAGQSGIVSGLDASRLAFATNELREAAFFHGRLAQPLVLRDALAVLHRVVASDLKYRPKDREAFRAWLEEQDRQFLRQLPMVSAEIRRQIDQRELRLAELNAERQRIMAPFFAARKRYLDFAWSRQAELDYLLDPVITIHPDELSFEVFSRDESSYARVALCYDLFGSIDAFECGTTNVDYSARLYRQLDRMRSYRETRFDVDAAGFGVEHLTESSHREKRIDLPDSWVNGFLQVQSVMTLGLHRIRLAPIDLFNLCRFLTRFRAHSSPRALRWELEPGRRARVVLEPWEHAIWLSPASTFEGEAPQRIRTWGRDRLKLLERLLPVVRRVDVYLAGHGLPSVYVCDLGDVSFTLALSGWTEQDWTGRSRFELLARRLDASADQLTATYHALARRRYGTAAELAGETGLGEEKSRAALSFLCQSGRAMFDLGGDRYRHRDLFFEPFSAKKALVRAKRMEEGDDPKSKAAKKVFEGGQARFTARRPVKTGYKLSGSVRGTDKERSRPLLSVDHEGRIVEATCTCRHFKKHRLTQGPCEHILALRLAHMARLEIEDQEQGET